LGAGVATFTSTTTPQLNVKYDASNHLTVAADSTGRITFDATGTGSDVGFVFNDAIYQPVYGSDDGIVLDIDFSEGVGEYTRDKSPYGNDGTRKPDGTSGTAAEDCEDAWDANAFTNITATADATGYKAGSSSAKFSVADAFTTGYIGTETISSTDISAKDYINLWIKSSVTESNLQLVLSETACPAGDITVEDKVLDIPAVGGSQWKRVELDIGDSSALNAVVCVGLKTTTTDLSVMNIWLDDLNAYNGPSFADGKYGTGMAFDGTDDYVDCGSDSSLDITDAITMEMWWKPSITMDSSYPNHFFFIKKTDYSNGFGLSFRHDSGMIAGYIYNSGSNSCYASPTSWNANTWYHIVFTSSSSSRNIYINGNLDNSLGGVSPGSYSGNLHISDDALIGSIDDVRIYNRALSSDEVKTHYLRGTKDHGLVKADKFRVSDTSGQLVFETDAAPGGTALTATQRNTGAIASLTNNALSTGAAFTLTNLGTGNSFLVEDSASADTTP